MRQKEEGMKGGISFDDDFVALKRAGTPYWGTRRMFEVQGVPRTRGRRRQPLLVACSFEALE